MSDSPAGVFEPFVGPVADGARIPVAIEGADLRDALATLGLHREVLAEDRWLVPHPDEPLSLETRQRELEHAAAAPNAFFLVARAPDRRIAGYIHVLGGEQARTRHVATFEWMVARAYRRRGIGRQLLSEALAVARRTEVLRKLSASVFADNAPALAALRSMGFFDEGRRIGQYQERDGRLRGDLLLAKFV